MRKIILQKIAWLKKKYSVNDPSELCEILHLKIMYENLGHINGFYQSAPRNKIIHINYNMNYNI